MTAALLGTDDGVRRLDLATGALDTLLDGRDVTWLAARGAEIWALAEERSVLRHEDGGWSEVATVPRLKARTVALSPSGVLVGTARARLFRVAADEIVPVEPFDAVPGRDGWYTPWGGPPDTRSIAVGSDGALYVNVHVGGIAVSRDGGATWVPTIDIDADVHQVLAHPEDPALVLAATAVGLARSDDGGATWTFHTDGLEADYCRAVAIAGDVILITASESHVGRRARVYRAPLDRRTPRFEVALDDRYDRNIDTGLLAAGAGVAVVATPDARVHVSRDGGGSWETIADAIGGVRAIALA